MRKLINGTIVEINNIELFNRAAEDMIIDKKVTNKTADIIDCSNGLIYKYVKYYDEIYKAMPFPLYGIESDVKYVAIGTIIKECIKDDTKMWADGALCVCIDNEREIVLRIVGNTWEITKKASKDDNIDIEKYNGQLGYEEYSWFIKSVLERKNSGNFYITFMPEFVRACEWQPSIMQKELGDILTFSVIPNRLYLQDNKIIDLENKSVYCLDIYSNGYKKTGESQYVMSFLDEEDDSEMQMKPKYKMVYGFNTYVKEASIGKDGTRSELGKLKEVKMEGMSNIFNTLCAIKMAAEKEEFESFTGFKIDRDMVYIVNNRLFVCKSFKASEPKEVATGVEIYGYDKGLVYFIKSTNIGNGTKKEIIYSYNLKDGTIKVCKIQFEIQ